MPTKRKATTRSAKPTLTTRRATNTQRRATTRMAMPTPTPTLTTRRATTRRAMPTPTPTTRRAMPMPTPTPTTRRAMPTPTPTTRRAISMPTLPTPTTTHRAMPKVNLLGLLPLGVLDDALHILDTRQLNMLNLLTKTNLLNGLNKKRPVNNPLEFVDVKITNNTIDTLCKIADTTDLHTLILDNVSFDKNVKIKTLFKGVEQLEKLVIKNMRYDDNLITFLSNIPRIYLFEIHPIFNLTPEDINDDYIKFEKFERIKGIQHTTRIEYRTAIEIGSTRDLRKRSS